MMYSSFFVDVRGDFRQNIVDGSLIENVNLTSTEMRRDIAEIRAVSISVFPIDPSTFMRISERGLQEPS